MLSNLEIKKVIIALLIFIILCILFCYVAWDNYKSGYVAAYMDMTNNIPLKVKKVENADGRFSYLYNDK